VPAVEAARLTVTPESAATTRHEVVAALAKAVMSLRVGHPIRVGVDGWSNAGKTTLADELAAAIQAAGRQSLRASIDNFHRKGHKYRSLRGEWTPQLYFDEGYDYAVFRSWVLDPLGPGGSPHAPDGSRRCRTEMLDAYNDVLPPEVWHDVAEDAVMIVDGIFLSHPDLAPHWEYLIWLDVDVETMISRALVRDAAWVGPAEAVEQRYRRFRQPVYEHYERLTNAAARAHAVVDNRDLAHPRLLRLTRP
jgi:uridine kinase